MFSSKVSRERATIKAAAIASVKRAAGSVTIEVTIEATAILANGPRCLCSNRGCLEALASGTAIQRRAREIANEQPGSDMGRLATERQVLGEDVTKLAQEGDEAAVQVLRAARVWGEGVLIYKILGNSRASLSSYGYSFASSKF